MHHRFVKLRNTEIAQPIIKIARMNTATPLMPNKKKKKKKIRHTEAQRKKKKKKKIHTRALNCFGILFPRASLTSSTLKANDNTQEYETTTRSI